MKKTITLFFTLSYLICFGQNKDGLVKTYYSNGELRSITNYGNGIKNGLQTNFYENGKKLSEANWINDKLDGEFVTYYENGKLKHQSQQSNGKPIGIAIGYYNNGIVQYKTEYKNFKKWNVLALNDNKGEPLEIGSFKNGNGYQYIYDEKNQGEGILWQKLTYLDGDIVDRQYYLNGSKTDPIIRASETELKPYIFNIKDIDWQTNNGEKFKTFRSDLTKMVQPVGFFQTEEVNSLYVYVRHIDHIKVSFVNEVLKEDDLFKTSRLNDTDAISELVLPPYSLAVIGRHKDFAKSIEISINKSDCKSDKFVVVVYQGKKSELLELIKTLN